jgi:hypothetical protein
MHICRYFIVIYMSFILRIYVVVDTSAELTCRTLGELEPWAILSQPPTRP